LVSAFVYTRILALDRIGACPYHHPFSSQDTSYEFETCDYLQTFPAVHARDNPSNYAVSLL